MAHKPPRAEQRTAGSFSTRVSHAPTISPSSVLATSTSHSSSPLRSSAHAGTQLAQNTDQSTPHSSSPQAAPVVQAKNAVQSGKARKFMPKPAVKSPLQALENEPLRIEAKTAEKTRGLAGKKVNQEANKTAEIQEVLWLMDVTRPSPPPLTLQLPNPPLRQNVSGRVIPLSLLPQDDSFLPTPAAREEFVGQVLVSMMDVREADDTISATTDFKNVWLKPALKQEFSYDVVDMERMCRELVSIAETLHTEGLGPTRIYCPRTIQKAVNAKPMSFKDRINKLSLLMRKSKSRCNDFMLGNTMEDTVALIEQKLADQKSNAANNKSRSVKLLLSNQLMGLEKGAKWRKDKEGEVTPPSPGISAPVDATRSSAAAVAPVVHQSERINFNLHYARGIDNQAHVFEQTPRHTNGAFGQETFMDHQSQLMAHSLLSQTTVPRQPPYNGFGGFEVAEIVSNFDLPEGVVPNLAERSRGAYPTTPEVNIHLEAHVANDSGLSIQNYSTHFDPNLQDGPLRDDINTPQFFDEDGSIPVDLFLLHNSVFPSFMPPTHSNDTRDAVAEQLEGQPAKRHCRGQPGEQSISPILRGHTARGPTRRKSTSHS